MCRYLVVFTLFLRVISTARYTTFFLVSAYVWSDLVKFSLHISETEFKFVDLATHDFTHTFIVGIVSDMIIFIIFLEDKIFSLGALSTDIIWYFDAIWRTCQIWYMFRIFFNL